MQAEWAYDMNTVFILIYTPALIITLAFPENNMTLSFMNSCLHHYKMMKLFDVAF